MYEKGRESYGNVIVLHQKKDISKRKPDGVSNLVFIMIFLNLFGTGGIEPTLQQKTIVLMLSYNIWAFINIMILLR